MNFLSIVSTILDLAPYVIKGVEQIHAGESTETKSQIAQQVLTTATQGAVSVLSPDDAQLAKVVSGVISKVIGAGQQVAAAVSNQPTPAPVATGQVQAAVPTKQLL